MTIAGCEVQQMPAIDLTLAVNVLLAGDVHSVWCLFRRAGVNAVEH